MPYPAEHSARIREPGDFEAGSFRSKDIAEGIRIILGKLKDSGKWETQAYRFSIEKFTAQEAKKWLKDHDIDYISFEPATGKMNGFKFCDKEIKDIDDKGVVSFYFSAFDNVDSDNDITKRGAFSKTMVENRKRIKHVKNHDISLVPGVIKELGEDAVGAWARSQLILGTQTGHDTYEEYKAGAITEHSFRFDYMKYEDIADPNDKYSRIRTVSEYKLWEVSSLTGWGANEMTPTIDVKGEAKLWHDLEVLLKLKNGDFSDEYLKKVEQKITEILKHLQTLRATTDESEPEPFNAIKYLQTNLKILNNAI
jgi:HK97 family phage prohead protease